MGKATAESAETAENETGRTAREGKCYALSARSAVASSSKAKGRKARDGRPAPACHVCCRMCVWCLVNSHSLLRHPAAFGLPVLVENRPQRLIEILAVLQERPAEQPFLHRTDLPKRAVPASVVDRSPRLEAMNPDLLEREADQQFGSILEDSGAPVW